MFIELHQNATYESVWNKKAVSIAEKDRKEISPRVERAKDFVSPRTHKLSFSSGCDVASGSVYFGSFARCRAFSDNVRFATSSFKTIASSFATAPPTKKTTRSILMTYVP